MGGNAIYQRSNIASVDPSAGLMKGLENQRASLKDVMGSIKDLMVNQEGQIIQANTMQAQDILKNRIKAQGLGVLAEPTDIDEFAKPFGNMIDKTALAKANTDYVDRIKNTSINAYSAEADDILAQTGDPIAAREHIKKRFLEAKAPSTFADTEAVNYDLRKAAEIKNIAVREQERLSSAVADVTDWAAQSGTVGAKDAIDVLTKEQPKEKQAAFKRNLTGEINKIAAPNDDQKARLADALKVYDDESESNKNILAETNKQKNAQTISISSSSGSSSGSDGSTRRTTTKHTQADLVDKEGKPIPAVSIVLGNHVNNWIEKLSGTSDSVNLQNAYQRINDKVNNSAVAADILKQSFDHAYRGNGLLGNDLKPKDFEVLNKKADELMAAHNDSGAVVSSSSNSSSGRSGNISFTDGSEIIEYNKKRSQDRVKLAEALREAVKNENLGYTPDSNSPEALDPIATVLQKFRNNPTATPAPTKTKVYHNGGTPSNTNTPVLTDTVTTGAPSPEGATARVNALFKEKGLKEVGKKGSGKYTDESQEDRIARLAAKLENPSPKAVAIPAPVDLSTMTPQQRTAHEMSILNARRKLQSQSPPVVQPQGPVNAHAGKVQVIDTKYGKVWVDINIARQRYGYKG